MKVNTKQGLVEVPQWEIPDEHDDPFLLFAKSRGFDPDFLASFGVHLAGQDEDKTGWVAIPYPHLSGVWHVRYRNVGTEGPKYFAPAGSSTHLYNPLHLGPNADEVWFAEGEFDTLALIAAGQPAIGIPGARVAKKVFASEWRLLFDSAQVVVGFDPDEAGEAASVRLAQAFAPRSTVFNRYPDGVGDWNDWWRTDPDGMIASLERFREGWGL